MFKQTINKIGKLLVLPFSEHFLFFISFFILATCPYILKQILLHNNHYSLIVATHCVAISYCVTFIINLIHPQSIRQVVVLLLMGVSAFLFALNIYCLFELGGLVDVDYLMLVLGTNPQEAKEFACVMLPTGIVIGVLSTYLFLLVIWVLSHRLKLNLEGKTLYFFISLVGFSILGSINNRRAWIDGPIKHYVDLYNNLSQYEIPDGSQFNHSLPNVIIDDVKEVPANIVLIIGESFAKFHSSLYGYDRLTNPRLGAFKDSSMLFTFDSVKAPAPTTSLALEYVLSTYSKRDLDPNKKWYDYSTIIDLMKACNFDCYWFSNQARTGQFNYIARLFAESCRENHFYQKEGTLRRNQQHDLVLVDSTFQFTQKDIQSGHHFIIYHMMGSHFDYSKRYPIEFARFKENDYSLHPQEQRLILASYDNSILYNDYVVEQIINLYEGAESIIIYLSDHGLDMYRSNPHYHAHGKPTDPVSLAYGVEVPFMIYASPSYQEKYPEVMQRIKYRQEHPKAWNSDDLPYLIMDLIGVTAIDGEEVKPKSVLN